MAKIQLGTKYFESSMIAVIEGEGKSHTKVWLQGSSPVDGAFLIPLPLKVVLEVLEHARYNEIAEDLARAESAEERDDRLAGMHGG